MSKTLFYGIFWRNYDFNLYKWVAFDKGDHESVGED